MKISQYHIGKHELHTSLKQETEQEDKTILMKEYDTKLQNIVFEMEKLTTQLKQKNKQYEYQREIYRNNNILSSNFDQQLNNINNRLDQFKEDTLSPQKQSQQFQNTLDSTNILFESEMGISDLRKEVMNLRQTNRQFENEVQTLRSYIHSIQQSFQQYQNEMNAQRIQIQQQFQTVESDKKTNDQTLALAQELENVIKVLQLRNQEIQQIKQQNEILTMQCNQHIKDKQALDKIISIQADQVGAKSKVQILSQRNTMYESQARNMQMNINKQPLEQEKMVSNKRDKNNREQNGQYFFNKDYDKINQEQKDLNFKILSPLILTHNDSLKQLNPYYLVTPKSNITNTFSDLTGRSTHRAETFHFQKTDFTKASQNFFGTSKSQNNSQSPSKSPRIVNLTKREVSNNNND